MQPDTPDRITATIPEFRRLSGIGRSRIYELLDAGELASVRIGSRQLILINSYRQLIARQREHGATLPTATPGRLPRSRPTEAGAR